MGHWGSDIFARLRVLDLLFLGICATALNTLKIANKHVGKCIELIRAARDVNVGAVHVEFTVADGV